MNILVGYGDSDSEEEGNKNENGSTFEEGDIFQENVDITSVKEVRTQSSQPSSSSSFESNTSTEDENCNQVSMPENIATEIVSYVDLLPTVASLSFPEVEQAIENHLKRKKEKSINLTEKIRQDKDFGNPGILQKIVDHFKIDEIGSNFPKDLFDPHGYSEYDFEESVRRRYSNSSSAHASVVVRSNQHQRATASADTDQTRKRKSKWGEPVHP